MTTTMEMGEGHAHEHEYVLVKECGANVCMDCNDHEGLARCYCGWALSGGNGYTELLDMGEQIEP